MLLPPPPPTPSSPDILSSHVCRYEDPSRCTACRLIHRWEASRRKTLEVLQRKGVVPWYGAWRVRPDTYVPDVQPGWATEVLPVVQPGERAPSNPSHTHPHTHLPPPSQSPGRLLLYASSLTPSLTPSLFLSSTHFSSTFARTHAHIQQFAATTHHTHCITIMLQLSNLCLNPGPVSPPPPARVFRPPSPPPTSLTRH
jgi:hypothetical protein